ncbi:MAG TPA: hypothetical protein VGG10_17805 [Rhizomicrobium sp.]|jgi:hypothetical protein
MNDALFQMMRFQVLAAALQSGSSQKLHDSYVFAWDACVYPLFNDAADFHKPFADQFTISRADMEELFKKLDALWAEKNVPTYNELEHNLRDTRWGDRRCLILGLRYMWLHDRFDNDFWKKLMKRDEFPHEAREITTKYVRAMDVYFAKAPLLE